MKSRTDSIKTLWCMLVLFSGSIIYAQTNCQVLLPEISGSYTGRCKKGLAHGKGLAVGQDSYQGRFAKGLPHGSGIYTWEDGTKYEGNWTKGKRHGNGKLIYPRVGEDSIVSGIWKDNIYMGAVPAPQYQIVRSRSVVRSSIRQINEMGAGIRLRIYLGGKINSELENFTMESDTGEQYHIGDLTGIQNAIVPYSVTIKYRTWNHLHTQQHDVVFEFKVNEPGTFDVTINN